MPRHGAALWDQADLIAIEDCHYGQQVGKPAAVLIGLIDDEALGLSILLTLRSQHLHHHAGQISLPGGMKDDSDANPVETALRETLEEVGIEAKYIQLIGGLAPYPTSSGFIITPIIARITPGFDLRADPFEVEEIFLVPMAFILDKKNHQHFKYTIYQKVVSKKPFRTINLTTKIYVFGG